MQIAGIHCVACGRPIVLDFEGTWCSQCKSALHLNCVLAGGTCPKCQTAFITPSSLFVFAKRCPACGRATDRREACIVCGERTRWDTMEDYQAARFQIHRVACLSIVRGSVLALCGLSLLAALVPLAPRLLLALGPCGGWLSMLLAAPIVLSFAGFGVWCLFKSWTKLWSSIPAIKFR